MFKRMLFSLLAVSALSVAMEPAPKSPQSSPAAAQQRRIKIVSEAFDEACKQKNWKTIIKLSEERMKYLQDPIQQLELLFFTGVAHYELGDDNNMHDNNAILYFSRVADHVMAKIGKALIDAPEFVVFLNALNYLTYIYDWQENYEQARLHGELFLALIAQNKQRYFPAMQRFLITPEKVQETLNNIKSIEKENGGKLPNRTNNLQNQTIPSRKKHYEELLNSKDSKKAAQAFVGLGILAMFGIECSQSLVIADYCFRRAIADRHLPFEDMMIAKFHLGQLLTCNQKDFIKGKKQLLSYKDSLLNVPQGDIEGKGYLMEVARQTEIPTLQQSAQLILDILSAGDQFYNQSYDFSYSI